MEVVLARCAGLDGHKKTGVACVVVRQGRGPLRAVETFRTTTPAWLTLQTWLTEHQVTHVAMESTGSYGKPVVRHEAPNDREEMQGFLQRAVAAVR